MSFALYKHLNRIFITTESKNVIIITKLYPQMSHRRLQAIFVAFLLLVMISASISLPADYEPGYDSYQPRDYSDDKREPDPPRPRKGKRGYKADSVYVYGADREQRRRVPDSYYEPISL